MPLSTSLLQEPTTDIDERKDDEESAGSGGQEGDETDELQHPPEVNGMEDLSVAAELRNPCGSVMCHGRTAAACKGKTWG